MAYIKISFQSQLLHRPASLAVLLPDGAKPVGTLYLLHGYSDGHESFIRNSALARYCSGIPVAVIMPEAQSSFYLNTAYGQQYWTHISEEVPRVLRYWLRLDVPRACSFVGGISMGGYGAAKFALQQPDRFSEAYLLSPVTDIAGVVQHGFDRSADSLAPDPDEMRLDAVVGGRNPLDTSDDLYFLLDRACASELPKFRIYTGSEDFLFDEIQRFVCALRMKGVDSALEIARGAHLWSTWEPFLSDMVARIDAQLR